MIAIAKYDSHKKAKLATFVTDCVNNRLIDIARYESHRPHCDEIPEDLEGTGYTTIQDLEFNMTMKTILTDREYLVYFKTFVEDRSIREISGKNKLMSRVEARTCYRSIIVKFQSLEKSQIKLLTQRTLQNMWLEDSQSLQQT